MPTQPIQRRGGIAVFALATPNNGDQTVEVSKLPDGFYWRQAGVVARGPFNTEDDALNAARAYFGYGPL